MNLLRLVSVAGAYEARLRARPLVQQLGLAAPARTIELLEHEYLLRQSDNGALLQGLHPLRSAILAELFDDPSFAPWSESASDCLSLIHPPDMEVFLLSAFAKRPSELAPLLAALARFRPTCWAAIRGVVRALLWLGLREYVEANRPLLDEAYADLGGSGYILLDFDIGDAIPGSAASVREAIGSMLPPARRQIMEGFSARQSDKREALDRARAWLGALDARPDVPTDVETWTALGEVLFWYGRLGVARPADTALPLAEIDAALDDLPLVVVADLVFGLATAFGPDATPWFDAHRELMLDRFRRETQTVIVEDDGEKVTARFIIELDQLNKATVPNPAASRRPEQQASSDPLHDMALLHIDFLRKLFPDRELYACQGYGHQVWSQPLPHNVDNTRKTGILRSSLPPTWLTQLNATFRGLSQQPHRPEDWPEYVRGVLDLRWQIVRDLLHLERQIDAYFRRRVAMKFVGDGGAIDAALWEQHKKAASNPPLLPSCALDEWGFFSEGSASRPAIEAATNSHFERKSWALQRFSFSLTSSQKYTRALANFYEQSLHVMLLNPVLGRGAGAQKPAGRAQLLNHAREVGVDVTAPRLSLHNLLDATNSLDAMQRGASALLAPFLDRDELARLERQERTLFTRFWAVWYWFAFHPRGVIPNALQEGPRRATALLSKRRASLRRAYERWSAGLNTIRILSESVPWDGTPALWIALDCPDPAATFEVRNAAIAILRETLGADDPDSLEYIAQQQAWPTCVFVPLVRSKLLEASAWPLQLLTLLREDGLNWLHDLRQTIPSEALASLDLNLWSLPRLVSASHLLGAASTLNLLIGHLRHLNQLTDVEDSAFAYGKSYFRHVCGQLSEAFQAILDAVAEMGDYFNALPPAEQAQRSYLLTTMQALATLFEAIPAELRANGSVCGTLQDIIEWEGASDQIQQHAALAYFAWAADVVDEHTG